MRSEIDFAGREIRGTREHQEDFYGFEEPEPGVLLLALADGVGGETRGDLASHAAVNGFLDAFATFCGPEDSRFMAALKSANRGVAEVIDSLPHGEVHMATTLLALRVRNLELHWISVGDSPLLLHRRGKLHRLNADHSGRAEHHHAGLAQNSLISALTGGRIRLIDHPAEPYPLEPGDLLLAASDGLLTLSMDEINAVLADHSASRAADIAFHLLAQIEARQQPSQDNTTVAVIRVG